MSTETTPLKPGMKARTALYALLIAGLIPAGFAAAQDTMGGDAAAGEAADGAAEAQAGTDTEAPEASALDVVATVGEKSIRLGDVITLRRGLPAQYQQLPDEILGRGLIDQLIDQTLLADKALEAGIDERQSVQFQLENQMRAVLAEAYMRAAVEERVNEDAVRAEYEKRYAEAEPPEEVRASHILVESEEQAQELREELDGGADFAALAAEHGTDGTAQRGGDLGYFVKEDMVGPFAEAAFEIEPGAVGGPVETQFGWHVIKVVDKRERPAPAFDDVASDIAQELVVEAQRAVVAELREGAEVTVTEPGPPAGAFRNDDLLNAPAAE
ncbi:MAG: peptidylprolyl isomerase [Pseudomonadota bacterium]